MIFIDVCGFCEISFGFNSRRFAQSAGPGMCTVVSFNLLFFLVVVVVVVVVGDVFFQTRLQSV